jgi:hypothetical protein
MVRKARYLESKGADRTDKDEEELHELRKYGIRNQRDLRKQSEGVAKTLKAEAKTSAAGVLQPGDVTKTLAFGFIGLTGATIAMKAAFTGINAVMTASEAVMADMIERGSGFRNVTAKVTSALADQTRQMGGYSQAAVAATTAQAGFGKATSDSIRPILMERATLEAGNKAMGDQLDLLHATQTIKDENARAAAGQSMGFGQPNGGIPGVTRATGGLFGTPINATPSMFERLSGEMGTTPLQQAFSNVGSVFNMNKGGGGTPIADPFSSGIASIFGAKGLMTPEQAKAQAELDTTAGVVLGTANPLQGGPLGPPLGLINGTLGPQMAADTASRTSENMAPWNRSMAVIDDWNAQLKKTGGSFEIVDKSAGELGKSQQAQQRQALLAAGVEKTAVDRIDALGKVFKDASGAVISTKEDVEKFGKAITFGSTMMEPSDLIAQMSDQGDPFNGGRLGTIHAQTRGFERQALAEREKEIPANIAMQYIAHPLMPYGKATLPQGGPTGNIPNVAASGPFATPKGQPNAAAEYEASFQKYAKYAEPAQERITAQIAKGRQVLKEWNVPDQLINDISKVGENIQTLSSGIEQRSLNLTVASYNNQLRIANRSLGDAKDLSAAIGGNVKNTLGGLEGQNIALGRQSQLLAFGLEQRQINFKMAMAGFTAPGDTPAQRQARIEQAKLEANYAQKQLDIQKKMGSGTFEINKIQASRSITDLQAQINLLVQERQLTIDSSTAQKALEAMNADEESLLANARSYMSVGQSTLTLMNTTVTEIEAATGKIFGEWGDQLAETFRKAGVAYASAIMHTMNPGTYDGGAPAPSKDTRYPLTGNGGAVKYNDDGTVNRDGNAKTGDGAAAGALFNTTGATSMTVGEAGTETVAVLRNPRALSLPGGGGGGGGVVNVNVNINGGDASEEKLRAWAKQIQMNVETALNRKTSLLGLRNP